MTTNQTIDGVPRELRALLERVVGKQSQTPHWDGLYEDRIAAAAELRALLDAPASPLSELEVLRAAVKELEAMRDARVDAKLAQGVPVAWIDWSGGDCPVDADAVVEYAMACNPQQVCGPEAACRLDWRHDQRPTKRKPNIVKYREIAEQPAPVAVVIDDNVEFEKWWMSTPILRKQKIQIAQEAWFARANLSK